MPGSREVAARSCYLHPVRLFHALGAGVAGEPAIVATAVKGTQPTISAQRFSSRFTDTGSGVLSSCANRETRNSRGNLLTTVGSANLVGNREVFNTRLRAVTTADSFNDFKPAAAQDVPAGWGYSLDFGLSRRFRNGATLALAVNDALGQISWDRVPLITQNINGTFAGNTFNSGASAIISGSHAYPSLTLDLKPKLRLEADYPLGESNVLARLEGVDGQWFPQIGVSYPLTAKWRLGLDYETRFGSATISLRHAHY